ncbi:MAG: hypothetical protein EAX96_16070 [Candidatus Lokiarchaeota archaeon]|nr:hypothetical protein [Candidatus Lokiarchaeota archaeon]
MPKDSQEERILKLISNMELKLAQLSDTNGLKKQVQELIFDKNNYEIRIKQLQDQILELQSRNQKLENGNLTIKELESELSLASDELVSLNNQISELMIKNQGLENKIRNWVNEKREYQIKLKKTRELIQVEKENNSEIKRTIRRLERRLLRGGKIQAINIATASAEPESVADKKFEIKVYHDKILNLENKIKMLQLQITKSPARDLELKVQELEKLVDEKEGKIFQFNTERQKYEQQLKGLQQRITDLQVSYQEQAAILQKENKRAKDMEVSMRTGIKDVNAREVISKLQEENKKLREDLRQNDKDIKILDKNTYSFKQQLDQAKRQIHALFNKNRELMIQLQTGEGSKTQKFEKGTDLMADAEDIEIEMRNKERKLNRLESMVKSLEQEIGDLKYSLSGRDIKIDELNNIVNEMKTVMAKSGIKMGTKK